MCAAPTRNALQENVPISCDEKRYTTTAKILQKQNYLGVQSTKALDD